MSAAWPVLSVSLLPSRRGEEGLLLLLNAVVTNRVKTFRSHFLVFMSWPRGYSSGGIGERRKHLQGHHEHFDAASVLKWLCRAEGETQ